MSHNPFEEEHRRLHDMLHRHQDEIEAARRHLKDAMKRARAEMDDPSKGLRALIDSINGLPPRLRLDRGGKRPSKRRGREPDAGGVPVEPNNPRNLSGGAAAVPEAEQ